jgi:hypothetical protein
MRALALTSFDTPPTLLNDVPDPTPGRNLDLVDSLAARSGFRRVTNVSLGPGAVLLDPAETP